MSHAPRRSRPKQVNRRQRSIFSSSKQRTRPHSSHKLFHEDLEPRRLLAADWQNATQPLDIDDDFLVTPTDVIVVINDINRNGSRELPPREADDYETPFYDTNKDGLISPNDVIIVVNALNRNEPLLAARLTTDSAPGNTTNRDGITNDAAFAGSVSNLRTPVQKLEIAFEDTPDDGWFDVTSSLSGSDFTISQAQLDQLAGGDFADGSRTIRIRATNQSTTESRPYQTSFVLDTVAPEIDAKQPVAGETLRPGARFYGTATGGDSELQYLRYWMADSDPVEATVGADASFEVGLELAPYGNGANVFHYVAEDLAGNVRMEDVNVTIALSTFELLESTPRDNSENVGVTVKPQVFFSDPVDPSTLTADTFYATAGGEKLAANIVPAENGEFAWLFFQEAMPGATEIEVTLLGDSIKALGDGSALDADGDGTPGGTLKFNYSTVSTAPVPDTRLVGWLVDPGPDLLPMTADDFDVGPDGEAHTDDDIFLLPVEGATVFLLGLEDQAVTTDANGYFELNSIPAGRGKVATDGRTAINPPENYYFPEMVMDAPLQPGKTNYVMPNMPHMYLPRIAETILEEVNVEETTKIDLKPEAALDLTEEERALLTIEVSPNSLVKSDGTKAEVGRVGVSVVPPELVVDMLPPGVLEHTFDLTIQAEGFSNFSSPAAMTSPNVFGAEPGTKLNFLSFDHNTGLLVIEGTGTVSADGKTITTDPDVGVTHPGWHGWTPPSGCNGSGDDPLPPPTNADEIEPNVVIKPPIFLTDDQATHIDTLNFNGPADDGQNDGPGGDGCEQNPEDEDREFVRVNIEVDGDFEAFLENFGTLDVNTSISLQPGETKTFSASSKTWTDMFSGSGGYTALENDQLYGARITITEERGQGSELTSKDVTVYNVYRWVSAVDHEEALARNGNSMAFLKTNTDLFREQQLELFLPTSSTTQLLGGNTEFFGFDTLSGSSQSVFFAPDAAGDRSQSLELHSIFTVEGEVHDETIGTIEAKGRGIDPTTVSVNQSQYGDRLEDLLKGLEMNLINYTVQPGDNLTRIAERFGTTVQTILDYNNIADPNLILPGDSYSFPVAIYNGVQIYEVSASFQAEFPGYMPWDRADLGAGGLPGVANVDDDGNGTVDDAIETGWAGSDDAFTAAQLTALTAFVDGKEADILAAVEEDYKNVSGIEVVAANAGADVTMTWDVEAIFTDGSSVFGYADFDRLADAHFTTHICSTNACDIPDIAKTHALAVGLNPTVSNSGTFGLAINMAFDATPAPPLYALATAPVNFAQYTANTVSHELAHTFGIVDAYDSSASPTEPHDIMMSGGPNDGNLRFSSFNESLLQASVGSLPLDSVADRAAAYDALHLYQRVFNQPDSTTGIRDEMPLLVEPVLIVTHADIPLLDDDLQDFGLVSTGESVTRVYTLTNFGIEDLTIDTVSLNSDDTPFSLDASSANDAVIPWGESVTFSVTYTPSEAGTDSNSITVTSDASNGTEFTFAVEGMSAAEAATLVVDLLHSNNLGGVRLGDDASHTHIYELGNSGTTALEISGIEIVDGAAEFGLLGVPADLDTNPIVLNYGDTIEWGGSFSPNTVGLSRAIVQITTNDPNQPLKSVSFVGTGLDGSAAHWGDDFVSIETPDVSGSPVLLNKSEATGYFEFYMAPGENYVVTVFDPVSGQVARGSGQTAVAGGNTDVTSNLVFAASRGPDSDFDGLPDEIEKTIGSLPLQPDTDQDNIDDFAEVKQGLDPTGGAFATGVIANLPLPGFAESVAVAGAANDLFSQIGYVASGPAGLNVVDVSSFSSPILIGQLPLNGYAMDVDLDPLLNLAVVAADTGGAHFIDISDPMSPIRVRSIENDSQYVEVIDGIAYLAQDATIRSYDLLTGDLLQEFTPNNGGNITGMAQENGFLYTMDDNLNLRSFHVASYAISELDSLAVNHGGGQIAVNAGIAYLAAENTNFRGGVATANVANPQALTYLSDPDVDSSTVAPGAAVADNGSGRALIVGTTNDGVDALDMISTLNPADTYEFQARFNLPATPQSIQIASGIAFVANGGAGLQVVNYLPFDAGDTPPTVNIMSPVVDGDPNKDGIQVIEGSSVPVVVSVQDDVQVRNVELLVNGEVVANEVSTPFDFFAPAPSLKDATEISIQVRTTDTGLNTSLSNVLTYELTPDLVGPSYVGSSPANGGVGFRTSAITLRFDEALDQDLLNLSGVELLNLGPDGEVGGGDDESVAVGSIEAVSDTRVLVRPQSPLNFGIYKLTVDKSILFDRAGNQITDSVSTQFTSFDVEPGTMIWVNPAGGRWGNPANWNEGRVPTEEDSVYIDNPWGEMTIQVDGYYDRVKNIESTERIHVTGNFTVFGETKLSGGIVLEPYSSLTATGPEANVTLGSNLTIRDADLYAYSGAKMTLGITSMQGDDDFYYSSQSIRASGEGSEINFPQLTTVGGSQYKNMYVEVQSGATIDMSQLSTVTVAASFQAWGQQAVIDLSSLTQFQLQDAQSLGGLYAYNGGEVRIPNLTQTSGVNVYVDGPMNVEQLTQVRRGSFTLRNGTFDLSNLQTLEETQLVIDSGAQVANLEDIANLNGGGIQLRNGSTLEMPLVTSYLANENYSTRYFEASNGSTLSFPNLESMALSEYGSLSFLASGGGELSLPKVPSLSGSVEMDVNDTESRLAFDALTSLFANENQYGQLYIYEGEFYAPMLKSLDGVDFSLSGTLDTSQWETFRNGDLTVNSGTVDLAGLDDLIGVSLRVYNSGQVINVSDITDITGAGFLVYNGQTLSLPGVTEYDFAVSPDDFSSRDLLASGTDSVLEFPNLTKIISSSTYGYASLDIWGDRGGQVRLPLVDRITGRVTLEGRYAGGLVDLPQLTTFEVGTSSNPSYIEAWYDGEINIPQLTQVDRVNFVVDGVIDTAQLTQVTNGRFDLREPADLSGLAVLDGSSIRVTSGETVTLPNVTSYTSNSYQPRTEFYTSGTNSALEFPNLTTIDATVTTSARLDVQARSNGRIDLPQLTSISGAAYLRANGSGSSIDASSLSTFEPGNASTQSLLEARSDATVAIGALTTIDEVDLYIDGVINTSQFTGITNANITVRVPDVDLGGLTSLNTINLTLDDTGSVLGLSDIGSLDGGGIRILNNATLSLPNVTSYTMLPGALSTVYLSASGAGSVLELPNLVTITGADGVDGNNSSLRVEAQSAGQVKLPKLETVTGVVNLTSRYENSLLDVPMLTSFIDGTTRSSELRAQYDATLNAPLLATIQTDLVWLGAQIPTSQIQSIQDANVYVDGIVADFSSMTSLEGLDLSVQGGGSIINTSGITNINNASIEVSDGAQVVLEQVTSYVYGLNSFGSLGATDTDSLLSLPNLTSIAAENGQELYRYLNVQAYYGGTVNLPSLATATGPVRFQAEGTDTALNIAALTSIVSEYGNAALRSGFGAAIDTSSLTTLDGVDLELQNAINTSQLTTLKNGALRVYDVNVDLNGLTELPYVQVDIYGPGSVSNLDDISNIEGSGFSLSNGASLTLPAVTTYVNHDLDGSQYAYFQADGAGSVLSLPNLESIDTSIDGFNYGSSIEMDAGNGGQILLPKLASIRGNVSFYSYDSGSLIDLDALSSFENAVGNNGAGFYTYDNGAIDIPALTELNRLNLTVGGPVPTSQIVEADYSEITVDGRSVDLSGLSDLDNVFLAIYDGGSVSGISQISSIDNGGITLYNSGNMSFPNVTSYTFDRDFLGLFTRQYFEAGSGSTLEFPNLTSITGLDDNAYFSLDAGNGTLSLPKLTQIDGNVEFYASGSQAMIDAPELSSFTSQYSYGTSISAYQGTINIPKVTSLDGIDLYVSENGSIPTSQLTQFGNATFSISGATTSLAGLTTFENAQLYVYSGGNLTDTAGITSIDGSSIQIYGANTVSLPGVTSLTTPAGGSARLEVSDLSSLELPNLTSITHVYDEDFSWPNTSFNARSRGTIDLSAVETISGRVLLSANSTGSSIDLSALQQATASSSIYRGQLSASSEAVITVPNLTTLQNFNVTVDGTLSTAQITSLANSQLTIQDRSADLSGLSSLSTVDLVVVNGEALNLDDITSLDGGSVRLTGSSLTLPGVTSYSDTTGRGERAFQASGTGALLSLPNLTQILGNSDAQANARVTVNASAGGVVSLPNVTSITQGSVQIFALGDNSQVDLSGVTTFTPGHDYQNYVVSATDSGEIKLPSLGNQLNRIDLRLDGTGVLQFDSTALEQFTNGKLELFNVDLAFPSLTNLDGSGISVTGPVTIELPGVTSYSNENGRVDRAFEVSNGATLDLTNMTSFRGSELDPIGPGGLATETSLRATGTDSRILASNIPSFEFGILEVSVNQGLIDLSSIGAIASTHATANSNLNASYGGRIELGALPTQLNRLDLAMSSNGEIDLDLSQLTQLTNSRLSLSSMDSPIALPSLTNFDGSTLDVYDVTLSMDQLTSYTNTKVDVNNGWSLRRSNVSLANLTTLGAAGTGKSTLTIGISDLPELTLPKLTEILVPASADADSSISMSIYSATLKLPSLTTFQDATDGSDLSSIYLSRGSLDVGTTATVFDSIRFDFDDYYIYYSGNNASELIGADITLQDSTLGGTGRVIGNLTNHGVIQPGGDSYPGVIVVEGDYVQTGALETELFDTIFPDTLSVTGSATLGGRLTVSVEDGFVPELNDQFDVLAFGSRSGDFATVEGLDLPNGLVLDRQFAAEEMTLTAAQPLRLAGSPAPVLDPLPLTYDQLRPIVQEALARWEAAGEDVSSLEGLQVSIRQLPDGFLGLAHSNQIVLDDDGAGLGWYLEDAVEQGAAVQAQASLQRQAPDLLSTVMHEVGHLLGYDDQWDDQNDVMFGELEPGSRRDVVTQLDQDNADDWFAQFGDDE